MCPPRSLSASHTFQYLKIQIFHDFLLCLAAFYVVVQSGSGVDLKHPIYAGFLANVALHHEIDTAQAQAHVAGKAYRDFFELGVDWFCYVEGIAAG